MFVIMKFSSRKFILVSYILLLLIPQAASPQVRLPHLVGDGMVLQRDADVRIWGWASTGEDITLHFVDKTYSTTADQHGNWEVILSEIAAGGPYSMEIIASP